MPITLNCYALYSFHEKKKKKLCATQTLRKMYQNIMISGMTSVHYVEQSQMHQAYPLKG